MRFTTFEHEKRFNELSKEIPANLFGDKEIVSVAYIMTSDPELKKKMDPYVDWEDGFNYEKMFEGEELSDTEKVLVNAAITMYDNGVDLHFRDVFTKLSKEERETVLLAAEYRFSEKGIYDASDGDLYIK